MCGIAALATTGETKKQTVRILLEALRSLEYRGYDSAGLAVYDEDEGRIKVWKRKGKVETLVRLLRGVRISAPIGIAHTRWATHGVPNEVNAHPHLDCRGEIAVVHNGIISNYLELKKELIEKGHVFKSETDTEVFAHLFEEEMKSKEPFEAFKSAISKLEGYYAIVAITSKDPERVFFARKESPLIVGKGSDLNMVSSDIASLLRYCSKVAPIEDGEVGWLTWREIYVEKNGERVAVGERFFRPPWTPEQATKGNFPHFMLKEIHEQGTAVKETLMSISTDPRVKEVLELLEGRVVVVAAGTSLHAGMVFSYALGKLLGKDVILLDSSEAYHLEKLLKDTVIAISQSGETYDTLKAVRIAKRNGAKVIGVVNVLGSTLDREADISLYTRAGPEIGVAATKTFLSQVTLLLYLVSRMSGVELKDPHLLVESSIRKSIGYARSLAERLKEKQSMFVLGTGASLPIAYEGALKIKEISYVHAEGYPAGEAKHGPIALAEEGFPVLIAWTPEDEEKLQVAKEEFASRGSEVYWVGPRGDIVAPESDWLHLPFTITPPFQLLAYYMAVLKGYDPDKPRNLAKSVTVH
ncbi:glucosamine--fructose-6-phosphate aminotransferase [Ignicoccus pacificus DSM 13166]|uniref:Glutamine--fructose-6-phosphate aminotransferase [isomerizing] n=1 Tax=Ignicoccus pacificus DSM 13166 TaxID=940294 RepID=A0A977K9V4_9CREN|nr:glucosamine--fructose-6-phosphate aminotransferase [Ignicoccus pacificus DSM 13166]